MKSIDEVQLQKLSQLVYLDVIRTDGINSKLAKDYLKNGNSITIGDLVDYYNSDTTGIQQLEERFTKELNGKPEIDYWKNLINEVSQDSEMRQWKISDVKPNSESGFAAMTIEPVDSTASGTQSGTTKIVVFRGSEPMEDLKYWNDWSNNLRTMYMMESPQQKEAREYMEELVRKYPELESLYTTGHSLGGNLALYSGFTLPDHVLPKLVTTTTFNAPGFNSALLEKHRQSIDWLNQHGKLTEYRNNGDIVPALFHNPSSGIYLATDFAQTDYMGSHSLFATSMSGTGFVLNHAQRFDLIPYSVKLLTTEIESLPYEVKETLVEEIDLLMTDGFEWERTMSAAFKTLPAVFMAIKDELKTAIGYFLIDQIRYKVVPAIKNVLHAAKEGLVSGLKAVGVLSLNLMEDWIKTQIDQSVLLRKWKNELQSAISSFFDAMENNFRNLVDRAVKWAEDEAAYWVEQSKRAVVGIATFISDTKEAIQDKAKELATSIKNFRDQKVDEVKAAAYKAVTLYNIGAGQVKKGAKILVRMREMESLEKALKKKERALNEILASALKKAANAAEQADRSYREGNVQAKVRSVRYLCDRISGERQVLMEQIRKQADGVREANAAYNTLESTIKQSLMRAVRFRF
ncbi:Mbeg1-like protein [Paenibacillus soyae]|uniref:DUF2974 domain-containing protein n=1 Tax=Paenibacillus soyae TaxID=2969249 RepID=A0A9X2S7R1_9BACL|nr:Mbeg1-like protein [Paenibacillus soyae]MCR2803390.1 DUF2974 domain-containing protein [Paenibacillus soyae]